MESLHLVLGFRQMKAWVVDSWHEEIHKGQWGWVGRGKSWLIYWGRFGEEDSTEEVVASRGWQHRGRRAVGTSLLAMKLIPFPRNNNNKAGLGVKHSEKEHKKERCYASCCLSA